MVFKKLLIAVAFVAGTSSGETAEESLGRRSGSTGGIRGSRSLSLSHFAALKADDPSQWTSLGCPTQTANSGDACTIPSGYEYMECTYGLRVCICQVQQPIFICQPYKPNQEWPIVPPPTATPRTPPPTMASTPGPTMSSTPGPTSSPVAPPTMTTPPTMVPVSPPISPPTPPPTPVTVTPGPTLSPPITFPTPQPISPPTTSSPPNDGRPTFPPNGNPAVQNPDGLCVTNGIGASCRYATFPTIACCTADDTGQFFNACCVKDFEGISFGGVTDSGPLDPNEFDVIIGGRGADCKANYNNDGLTQGCAVYDTPGNMPTVSSQPVEYKPGVEGPCLKIEDGEECDGTHTGTCTNDVFGTFKVCCPKCATGTYGLYSPGDSCQVTLPDPAACGYGDIVAPVAPAPTAPTEMPILSGVPAPTEMPILSGVPAPTEMPILSGVPAPTEMPILSGVPAPTEMPILSGVPAPTEMPILSGVPAPTEMPILSGVPEPTEGPGGDGSVDDCPPLDPIDPSGTPCALPEGKAGRFCASNFTTGEFPDLTFINRACACTSETLVWECDVDIRTPAPVEPGPPTAAPMMLTPSDVTWCPLPDEPIDPSGQSCTVPRSNCTQTIITSTPPSVIERLCMCDATLTLKCENLSVTTQAPASGPVCPPQEEDPPTNGSSCGEYAPLIGTKTCSWERGGSNRPTERVNCACDANNPVWNCDGSLTPVVAPTLMPAGQTLPTVIVPVPTAPVEPNPIEYPPGTCPANTPPDELDGTSCEGVVPENLPIVSCSFTQTSSNGETKDLGACECLKEDPVWKCDSSGGSGGDSSNSGGSSSGGAPEFNGPTTIQESGQECPTDPNEANGTNCCKFLPAAPGVAVEASCQYGSEYEFEACDCPGQLDTEGISYCQTIGWNCRTP